MDAFICKCAHFLDLETDLETLVMVGLCALGCMSASLCSLLEFKVRFQILPDTSEQVYILTFENPECACLQTVNIPEQA